MTIAKAKLAKPAITATTGIVCVKKTIVKITPSVAYLAKYRTAKNLGGVPCAIAASNSFFNETFNHQ